MKKVLQISSTERLQVLHPSEAGRLYELIARNREHLRQWLPWVDSTRGVDDVRRFAMESHGNFLRGGGFNFGIHVDGQPVGVIGYHAFDLANRVTSLGYWLAEEASGKGTMRRAVSACVTHAFNDRGMNRVYIRCATENKRSRRIPEALGFIHEGCQREAEWLYDHYVNLELYSMLRREWPATKPPLRISQRTGV